ncbi:Cysteine proteinase 1, mitochondrial [Neolecta irregularis DAH-3]|uniref:Cysteine proteinase 1, mitochondrial n=1 Tax=Neolecta irregularis (strain DAH-3) TaxID=1198029 RepID=A0A1U7LH58_NEOID|nr:Cysteine proteinase 1, mitochondrial [Neolecta irregularis DAH-3]|eukprot:OLL21990.1 Cysteine proteinase 1, mitochondrial [Neolecta irregularis DAH-3]
MTNVIRIDLMRKFELKTFQFSQSYLFFWDKFEKANCKEIVVGNLLTVDFLESMIELADRDLDDRVVQHLLKDPVSDGGQYDMLNNLLNKYGLLPQYLYPDSFNASMSGMINRLVTSKLREFTIILRVVAANERAAEKSKMVQEIYGILVTALGRPPKPQEEFTWEYVDKDEVFHSVKTNALDFYKMSGYDINDQLSLMNDPRHEYGKKYTIDRLGNVRGGRVWNGIFELTGSV